MNNPDARAFEEKLLTIDMIDGLRREQERFDVALGDAERMKALRGEIQAYYAQAGISVSDTLIDKAIAERQQQRFAFKPARLGIAGRVLASCYVYRGRLAAGVVTVTAFSLFLWLADRQVTQWQQQGALADYRAALEQQLADVDAARAAIVALPAQLPGVSSDLVPALPTWMLELNAAYQQSQATLTSWQACQQLSLPTELALDWPGAAQLESCHAQLPSMEQAATRAQQTMNEQSRLASAVTIHTLLNQRLTANPALLDWQAVSAPYATVAASAATGGNRQQFIEAVASTTAAADALNTLADRHRQASSCVDNAIMQASAADSRVLATLLNEGAALKQDTSTAGIAAWTTRANDTCQFFNTPIMLRIVNERGVDTGVWRYYDGNQNARTYYIIVDALTPAGGDADAWFQSVEDQRSHHQQRFGVQVAESVFNAIRQDKQDDGLLSDIFIGEKAANSLGWQLDSGFETRFIAEW